MAREGEEGFMKKLIVMLFTVLMFVGTAFAEGTSPNPITGEAIVFAETGDSA